MISNRTVFVLRLFLIITLTLYGVKGLSQDQNGVSNEVEETYNEILNTLGKDQVLSNGVFFENTSRNDLGHPYFQEDQFENGYIVLRNKRYNNLLIKYDIYNQEVVIINLQQKPQFAYKPPTDFITEFGFGIYKFKKEGLIDSANTFCQIIYNGELKCYYVQQKKRSESYHNVKFSAFKYLETKPTRYLIKNGAVLTYKSNGSFLKLFNPEDAKQIKKYLSENKVKVNKSDVFSIEKLIAFCEQISISKISTDE